MLQPVMSMGCKAGGALNFSLSMVTTAKIKPLWQREMQMLLKRQIGIATSAFPPLLGKGLTGRYRVTIKQDKPITYEEAHRPFDIAMKKAWNSYNTANHTHFGLRKSETATEDMFIRKFMTGTWHNLFVSEILIKRQANMIRVAGIIQRSITPRKMYFLIGYTEELLSYWLQCPIKLELQTVNDKKDVVYKYV